MCHLNSSHDCWCCAAAGGGGGGAVPVVTWTFHNGGQWGHFRVGQASRLRVGQTNRLHFDSEWMCFQVTNTLSPGPFSGTTYYWSMVTICHETIYPSHTYPHAQSQCLACRVPTCRSGLDQHGQASVGHISHGHTLPMNECKYLEWFDTVTANWIYIGPVHCHGNAGRGTVMD